MRNTHVRPPREGERIRTMEMTPLIVITIDTYCSDDWMLTDDTSSDGQPMDIIDDWSNLAAGRAAAA